MKKVIISDFFGVVIDESAPVFYGKYFLKQNKYELGAKYFHPGDRGEMTFEEIINWSSSELNFDKELFRKEILDAPSKHGEYVELLRKLKEEGHMIVLLSNAPDFIIPYELKKHGIETLFDKKFISHELKITKPSKEIFEYALKDTGIEAKDAIFIDDNKNNCQTAESFGIRSIIFKNDQKTLDLIKEIANS